MKISLLAIASSLLLVGCPADTGYSGKDKQTYDTAVVYFREPTSMNGESTAEVKGYNLSTENSIIRQGSDITEFHVYSNGYIIASFTSEEVKGIGIIKGK